MQTHTPDANSLEIPISTPGDTSGAHRRSSGRQERIAVGRRPLLQTVIGGIAGMMVGVQRQGAAASALPCREAETKQGTPGLNQTGNTVLLAYFSRAGENYYYGDRIDLEVGNTEVLAGMINEQITCDVYRIEPVDPYPWDYEETRARNVQEQDTDARPAIANPLISIEGYDVVLLGSPIWNVRAPMIMSTFAESFDLTGKTVYPVVTYAVSGLGSTESDYATLCPGATIGEGLAVQGEEVQDGGPAVEAWLQRIGLRTS
jgi:flavodoxin